MNDAVIVGTTALAISMGGIVVLAVAAGLLVAWIEKRVDHGDDH